MTGQLSRAEKFRLLKSTWKGTVLLVVEIAVGQGLRLKRIWSDGVTHPPLLGHGEGWGELHCSCLYCLMKAPTGEGAELEKRPWDALENSAGWWLRNKTGSIHPSLSVLRNSCSLASLYLFQCLVNAQGLTFSTREGKRGQIWMRWSLPEFSVTDVYRYL